MIAAMMAKMVKVMRWLKERIWSGIFWSLDNPQAALAVLFLIVSFSIMGFAFRSEGQRRLKVESNRVEMADRLKDLTLVNDMMKHQVKVLNEKNAAEREAGRHEMRIEAIKAGVAKWVIVDIEGTLRFEWVSTVSTATNSASL